MSQMVFYVGSVRMKNESNPQETYHQSILQRRGTSSYTEASLWELSLVPVGITIDTDYCRTPL